MVFCSLLLVNFELEFNPNFFETNLFNILVVIGFLYYVYKASYQISLETKQKEIIKVLDNSEKNFSQSSNYYFLSQKLYKKAFLIFINFQKVLKTKKNAIINEKSDKLIQVIQTKILFSKKLLTKKKLNKLVLAKQYLLYLILDKIIKKYLFENSSFKNNILFSILNSIN